MLPAVTYETEQEIVWIKYMHRIYLKCYYIRYCRYHNLFCAILIIVMANGFNHRVQKCEVIVAKLVDFVQFSLQSVLHAMWPSVWTGDICFNCFSFHLTRR